MSRIVYSPEEVIVVSKGKEDIGKLVELGNDGKFDPSVIPMVAELQDKIDEEATARSEADAKLQTNIDSETSARIAADQQLQDQITKEITDRTDADGTESSTRAGAIENLQKQIDALKRTECVPAGVVEFFAMTAAPNGWLKADGSAVSRTDYATLFNAIGTTFGAGDGSTNFNLPDLRGEFVRGFDDGRGLDAERTLGSIQTGGIPDHVHEGIYSGEEGSGYMYYGGYLPVENGGKAVEGGCGAFPGPNKTYSPSTSINPVETDGIWSNSIRTRQTQNCIAETRPCNVALLACIKY